MALRRLSARERRTERREGTVRSFDDPRQRFPCFWLETCYSFVFMKNQNRRFSSYLSELRSAAGWSLRELSKASGLSVTRLWAYEHGKQSPKLEALARLSSAFEMPLHRFLRPLG